MPAAIFATSQPGGTTSIDNWDVPNAAGTGGRALRQMVGAVQHAPARTWSQWYNLKGQRYIATTDYVVLSGNTSNQLLAAFLNPDTGVAATNVVILFDKVEFGSAYQTTFSRFGTTVANISVVAGQAASNKPIGRTDGGTSTSGVKIYTGSNGTANVRGTNGVAQFTVPTPGTLRKVAMMDIYSSYMLDISGTSVLQPGQAAYWAVDEPGGGVSGNFNNYIDFEWVEIPKLTWDAMATELQARLDY